MTAPSSPNQTVLCDPCVCIKRVLFLPLIWSIPSQSDPIYVTRLRLLSANGTRSRSISLNWIRKQVEEWLAATCLRFDVTGGAILVRSRTKLPARNQSRRKINGDQ